MTFHTPPPVFLHALRHYSGRAGPTRAERLGALTMMGYCCIAFSAPFAGAALMSQRAQRDKRYANMRPLSFRDCLPGSPLEDYAGLSQR